MSLYEIVDLSEGRWNPQARYGVSSAAKGLGEVDSGAVQISGGVAKALPGHALAQAVADYFVTFQKVLNRYSRAAVFPPLVIDGALGSKTLDAVKQVAKFIILRRLRERPWTAHAHRRHLEWHGTPVGLGVVGLGDAQCGSNHGYVRARVHVHRTQRRRGGRVRASVPPVPRWRTKAGVARGVDPDPRRHLGRSSRQRPGAAPGAPSRTPQQDAACDRRARLGGNGALPGGFQGYLG